MEKTDHEQVIRRLREEVEKLGERVSSAQIERYRQAGFIPQTDGRRAAPINLSDTAREVVTIGCFLRSKGNRSLDRAVLPLFFAGCRVRENELKDKLLEVYGSARRYLIEESAKYRKASDEVRPQGRPSRIDIAEGAALAHLKANTPSLRPLLTRVAVLSRQNKTNADPDVPQENPQSLLASALSHFYCVFLYGRPVGSGWEAIPELLYMIGIERFVRVILARFGVKVDNDFNEILASVLPALSLPALERTVSGASGDDLHAMRDELLVALADAQVFREMLPVAFGEGAKPLVPLGRSRDEYLTLTVLLPAVRNMRRLAAAEGRLPVVRELHEQVPEITSSLAALNDPAAEAIDRRQLRRDTKKEIASQLDRESSESLAD